MIEVLWFWGFYRVIIFVELKVLILRYVWVIILEVVFGWCFYYLWLVIFEGKKKRSKKLRF